MFPKAEVSKSEDVDIMYVVCFEHINEDNVEDWQQSDACEPGFQYMTERDNVSAAPKQEGEEEGGIMTVQKKEKVVSMFVTAVLMC